METRILLKFSLITALIGLFILILLANSIEPEVVDIQSINERMIDEWVRIRGNVTEQRTIEGLTILTIYDGTAGIDAVFRKEAPNMKGTNVILTGKIVEYRGTLEIEISEIKPGD
ncbi:MAG: hypothetical protein K6T16_01305 [Candidatus Pacearchaeota archaeon]|nr:hypothetical protein [Candidatus Pacearchaeota archaeon]